MGAKGFRAHRFVVTLTIVVVLTSSPSLAQFIERVDVSVANIDVVVTDRDGNPVRGLTRDDFQVFEDGKLQTITNFSAIEADDAGPAAVAGDTASPPVADLAQPAPPRLIVMFIDIDDIEPIRRRQFFEGIREFLDSSFREGDLFTLFTWNRRVSVAMPPTSSRAQVEALMDGLATSNRWSESEILTQAAEARKAQAQMDAEFASSLGMGDIGPDAQAEAEFQDFIHAEVRCAAIKRKATELKTLITSLVRVDMHKVLVFASDDLSLSPSRDCSTARELDALAEAANAYGMTIHAFHPPGQRERRVGYGPDTRPGTGMPSTTEPTQISVEANKTFEQATGLLRLAERTGGLSAVGAGMSARRLEQAATELENYYSIGYHFSEGNEDAPRNVRVTTKNPEYRVRARKTVVRLSETSRLRDELTANLYLPAQIQSQSPAFDVKIARTERDGRFSQVHLELSILARDLVLLTSADEKGRGSFSVFVVGGRELGDASPVAEMKQDFEAETDAGDSRLMYAFATRVRPDTRRLSIAVRDNVSGDVATKVVILAGSRPTVPVTTAPATPHGPEWQEALRRASAEKKPVLVFSHPEPCAPDAKGNPCKEFAQIVAHPAMQRRLSNVIFFESTLAEDQEAYVSVFDPSGTLAVSWFEFPRQQTFLRMLELVDGARLPLIRAQEAAMRGDRQEQMREWAIALLALGNVGQGRVFLEALRASSDPEDQQLAAIWLENLNVHQQGLVPPEDLYVELANNGSTDRVRFEGWMAAGNLRMSAGRIDEAIVAYRSAVAVASTANHRLALAALRTAEENASTVLGLGGPGSVVVGKRTIQPRPVAPAPALVEFRLDGRLVASSRRAPFATAIDFGKVPQRRILEVRSLDAAGRVSDRARVVVNPRSDEYSIRIVEPSSHEVNGLVDVAVATQVPRGRMIESVLVEWNDRRVALMTSAPYRTRFEVRDGERGILRAVLRLDDGREVEDVLLANAGAMTFDSKVHLVEVPVYAERELTSEDIVVKESGRPRAVDRVISADESPLRIALVLDASSSMDEHILDVQEAAIRFVESQFEDRDRIMTVAFNQSARIIWPTNDRRLIERAILEIQPRGNTALHDAMTIALLQIPSPGSRRALVVFSDGMDTNSLLSAGDVAEVARRSGVPIYVLSLRPTIGPHTPRSGRSAVMIPTPYEVVRREQGRLRRLTRSTGGKTFNLDSLEKLESIFAEIGEDLRKQSLVIYQTEPSASEWRPVEVSLRGRGSLRSPEGVYVAGEGEDAQ